MRLCPCTTSVFGCCSPFKVAAMHGNKHPIQPVLEFKAAHSTVSILLSPQTVLQTVFMLTVLLYGSQSSNYQSAKARVHCTLSDIVRACSATICHYTINSEDSTSSEEAVIRDFSTYWQSMCVAFFYGHTSTDIDAVLIATYRKNDELCPERPVLLAVPRLTTIFSSCTAVQL